ncbi:MAG: serine/threonine protein kinase [Muribaculaceae bacterium]|nr:serine/threonine protein kinase [Muribaculaceae bacterium]
MQQLSKGSRLQGGKYIIERVLGQGGFGITYLAIHSILEKYVAIKEFFPKDFCERDGQTSQITLGNANTAELVAKLKDKFIKEAKNISKLNHPNIVSIHDIFEENGTAYYLMDFIDGVSLHDKIKSYGPMCEVEAVGYIREIGSAIGYMHTKSMNHLDVKPANIMLRESDNTPILIDFGLAKQYDSTGEQTSTTPIGISHGFAPIEQYRPGGVSTFTPQTDIYALGATLYNLLSGQVPPHYSEILEDGLPELPVSVSQQSVDAITHAMELNKNRRPASIKLFLNDLPTSINVMSNDEGEICHDSYEEAIPVIDVTPKGQDMPSAIEPEYHNEGNEETKIVAHGNMTNEHRESNITDSALIMPVTNEKYIDLGLSVKWGSKFIGIAEPSSLNLEKFSIKLHGHSGSFRLEDLERAKYRLPSITEVEELISECEWYLCNDGEKKEIKIVGCNGNTLRLPLTSIDEILLQESSDPDRGGDCYLFHVSESVHYLHKCKPCLTNIWTVKA